MIGTLRTFGEELHKFRRTQDELIELLGRASEIREVMEITRQRADSDESVGIEAAMPPLLLACLGHFEQWRSEAVMTEKRFDPQEASPGRLGG